jgi:hypothetical protein
VSLVVSIAHHRLPKQGRSVIFLLGLPDFPLLFAAPQIHTNNKLCSYYRYHKSYMDLNNIWSMEAHPVLLPQLSFLVSVIHPSPMIHCEQPHATAASVPHIHTLSQLCKHTRLWLFNFQLTDCSVVVHVSHAGICCCPCVHSAHCGY